MNTDAFDGTPAVSFKRALPRLGLAALLCLATLALHALCIVYATLLFDDFQLLTASYSWDLTRQNLWQPHNEHVMPLGRLSTWLLVQVAGRPAALPTLAALQGPMAVLVGMGLIC